MKKQVMTLLLAVLMGILMMPFNVWAEDDPEVISASSEAEWGTGLENIMITIHTNKDVDQIILSSGQGEILLTPATNYSEDDLIGNNEVMDLNGDMEVTRDDYEIEKKHVEEECKDFTATVRCSHCGAADIDGDGDIDEDDLKMIDDHITGNCTLSDCYFHGTRTYREETDDDYVWTFHYTPTVEGIDTMTLTPQAVTSTGVRSGDIMTLDIHSEEYKNPEILRYYVVPNQDKYLVHYKSSIPVTIYAVTPLETDKVKFNIANQLNTSDVTEVEVTEFDSIDYDTHEKTWKYEYITDNRGWRDITITGYGDQSDDVGGWLEGTPVTFQKRVVDPLVLSCNTTTVTGWLEVWYTYWSSTDADGNTTSGSTRHERQWYDHTTTAICNEDTDYVYMTTSGGSGYNYAYSTDSNGNHIFTKSWTDLSGSATGSADPYATITVYPNEY